MKTMKKVLNKKIFNPFVEQVAKITYSDKDHERDMVTADIARLYVLQAYPNQAPQGSKLQPPTMEDSHMALRILDTLRPFKLLSAALGEEAPDCIAFESDEYEWLLKGMKDRGTAIFGILAATYVNALEDMKLVHEPAKKRVEEEAEVS